MRIQHGQKTANMNTMDGVGTPSRIVRSPDRVRSGLRRLRMLAKKADDAMKRGDVATARRYAKELERQARDLAQFLSPPKTDTEKMIYRKVAGIAAMARQAQSAMDKQDGPQARAWLQVAVRAVDEINKTRY